MTPVGRWGWPAAWAVAGALLLTLAAGPHGQETFGSWFLARLLTETGLGGSLGRSPLYVLWSALFLPLGYPWAVVVARFLDAVMLFAGVYALACMLLPRWAAIVAALAWMPTLFIEPSVQGLAVSLLCGALALRRRRVDRAGRALFYALLATIPLIRINYVAFLLGFAAWDLFGVWLRDGMPGVLRTLRLGRRDSVAALPLLAMVAFATLQSSDPWNNAWYGDMRWSGLADTSLATAAQMGAMVQYKVLHQYDGAFIDHDIWRVIHEDFNGAGDLRALLAVDPGLVARHALANLQLAALAQGLTGLGRGLNDALAGSPLRLAGYGLFWLVVLAGLAGRWRQGDRESSVIALIAAGACLPLLLVPPSERYLLHLLPVFLVVGVWWGQRLPGVAGLTLALIAFGGGAPSWVGIGRNLADPVVWERPGRASETLGGAHAAMQARLASCHGLMTTQEAFQVAFGVLPRERVLSVFEIPPFGRLADGGYDGLRPERVDCLVWSEAAVSRSAAQFTTLYHRYENYLAPYVAVLKGLGAAEYRFPGGFRAVVLPARGEAEAGRRGR